MNRHHRQIILAQIGEAGQQKLRDSHALIVGVGALGTVIAESLLRAGVGTLTLVDRDVVELTNLQRQTLYTEADAREAKPKALAARDRLVQIDSGADVRAVVEDFSSATALGIASADPPLPEGEGLGEREDGSPHAPACSIPRHATCPHPSPLPGGEGAGDSRAVSAVSLLLDGTDNFETRYLLNDLSVSLGIPYVCAGAVETGGTLMTVVPGGPCLRCVFPDIPAPGSEPTCDTAGVLGPAVGAVAHLAAAEAIKLLSGNADAANQRLIQLDAWAPSMRSVDLSNATNPDCPCCAHRRFDFLDGEVGEVTSLCGRRSVQIAPAGRGVIELNSLAERLSPFGDFAESNGALRGAFSSESGEWGPITLHVFATGRAIVGGTTDTKIAKSIYARFIGG